MTRATLDRLIELLEAHTNHAVHIELAINTGAMVNTIDNEEDALATIRRMEARFVESRRPITKKVRREKA